MNVFNFILSVLVLLGFFIAMFKTDTKPGNVGVGAFIIGALLLAASVFGDGIGFIIWRV